MKSKTNISIKDLRGVRVTPSIELGNNVGYSSGDLLDANATLELVTKKIIELVNGADSSFDTLKELEDYVKQLNSYLQSLERKLNNLENTVNSLDSKYVTISNFNNTVNKLGEAIEELKDDIEDILAKIESLTDEQDESYYNDSIARSVDD